MPDPSIVVLASRIGAGKSTLARALAQITNLPIVSFGQYVKSVAIQRNLPLSRENLQNVGEELVISDPVAFTQQALECVNLRTGAIVDGLRHQTVLTAIRSLASELRVVVIFIQVPDEIQRERLMDRGMTPEEILSANNHPMELALEEKLLPLADLAIDGTAPTETSAHAIADYIAGD